MSSQRLKRSRAGRILALVFASVLAFAFTAQAASADDVVSNPGPFTATITGGALKLGTLDPIDVGTLDPPATVDGTIGADGSINVPKENVVFPPLEFDLSGIPLTVVISAPEDATGQLDPTTGEVSLNVTLQAAVTTLGPDCVLGPITIPAISGTTTWTGPEDPPDGWEPISGSAYDQGSGETSLVSNTFEIPAVAPTACFGLGGVVNDQVGLPAAAGVNSATLDFDFDPAPQGPVVPPGDTLYLTDGIGTFGSNSDVPAVADEGVVASFSGSMDENGIITVPSDQANLPSFEGDFGSISFAANGTHLAGVGTANGKLTLQGPVRVEMVLPSDDGELSCHATTRIRLRTDQRALYNGARFAGGSIESPGALAAHWDSIPNVRGDVGCADAAVDVAGAGGMLISR